MTDTEKAALERRIDELCAEVERLRADQAHWELGNCPSCPNVVSLQEALEQNAKLRQQLADVAESMGRVEERCAKLRELASDMWKAISTHKRINFAQLLRFGERMHELGVEVD